MQFLGHYDSLFLFQHVADISLPAVFMPTKTRDLNIYNSRAHQYFHATGKLLFSAGDSISLLFSCREQNFIEVSSPFISMVSYDTGLIVGQQVC